MKTINMLIKMKSEIITIPVDEIIEIGFVESCDSVSVDAEPVPEPIPEVPVEGIVQGEEVIDDAPVCDEVQDVAGNTSEPPAEVVEPVPEVVTPPVEEAPAVFEESTTVVNEPPVAEEFSVDDIIDLVSDMPTEKIPAVEPVVADEKVAVPEEVPIEKIADAILDDPAPIVEKPKEEPKQEEESAGVSFVGA